MADISRADALALINQQNMAEVFQQAAETSVALSTFRRVQMSAKEARMPVLDALPTASFLAAEADVKPTSHQVWASKTLTAEELAVIIPIPENVFDDAAFDIWGEVRPRVAEAIGAALDAAVLFGTGKPASWPDGIAVAAEAAGNVVAPNLADTEDLAEHLNQAIGTVEGDGFDCGVVLGKRLLRQKLRGLRDSNGQLIYSQGMQAGDQVSMVWGVPIRYVTNGAWGVAADEAIVGDPNMAVIGIRQDIEFKILTEASITGVGSLAEKDMIALRAKARFGFQVADPTTITGGATAYPFCLLKVPA